MTSAVVLLVCTTGVLVRTGRALLRAGRDRRRRTEDGRRAVEALRALAAELTAGAPPLEALRVVGADLGDDRRPHRVADPVREALVLAGAASDEPAAAAVLRDASVPALSALGSAWQVSAASGAPLSDVLSRLASAATRAAADRRDVETVLAGPRTTARLLALLPALGLLLASSTGAHPVGFLLGSGGGRVCLLAGVTLDAAGLLWIERLARSDEP
ncbi:MAG TPA: type II secretion system F family protein [Frankiaceae bacterium]|nr:type II secretion system F family protein [Frankiaceae bacterium]